MLSLLSILFFVSIVSAFLASAPVGPVNLYLAQTLLMQGKKNAWLFVIGVIISDLVYIFLGFWTFFFISDKSIFNFSAIWHVLTGLVIMALGFVSLLKKQQQIKQQDFKPLPKSIPYTAFFTGLVLCASNVMLFVLWLFIAGLFDTYGFIPQNYFHLFLILLGSLIGDLVWFGLFIHYAKKGMSYLKPNHTYQLQKIIAISLVLFGLFTACRQL